MGHRIYVGPSIGGWNQLIWRDMSMAVAIDPQYHQCSDKLPTVLHSGNGHAAMHGEVYGVSNLPLHIERIKLSTQHW